MVNKKWPTKTKDLHIAQVILEEYADKNQTDTLGVFEIVFNAKAKRMDFQLAHWIQTLAHQFTSMYGDHQGDFVTRQVVSRYMTQGHTIQ